MKIEPINHLISTILRESQIVVFLGAGASREGFQGEKPYPGFDQLISKVLEDEGLEPSGYQKDLANFRDIVKRWDEEASLPVYLTEYLYGEPGPSHYYLGALALSLFPSTNMLLFLTTNYDNLLQKAFTNLEKHHERRQSLTVSLQKNLTETALTKKFESIQAHTQSGSPVILKLFGDLGVESPLFRQEDMTLEPTVERWLTRRFQGPMIFIGYSFSDRIIRQLFLQSRGRAPAFLVTPGTEIPEDIQLSKRVYHLKMTFGEFALRSLSLLKARSPAHLKGIDRVLEDVDPVAFLGTVDAIRERLFMVSSAAFRRAEEKLPKAELDGTARAVQLVKRHDAISTVDAFLVSDNPLMLLIGDSGSGKSTLLYQIASRPYPDQATVYLFYDAHQLQGGSLTDRLARDLRCTQKTLDYVLRQLSMKLSENSLKLLILIDGINEITSANPTSLKFDIDDVAPRLPSPVKIIYSCRSVYWDTFLAEPSATPSATYFRAGPYNLQLFTEGEAREAFLSYQKVFNVKGSFENLRQELQEKLRDPLMLRMLAEGYSGRALPEFAPAVLIFESYEKALRRRYLHTGVIDYLEDVVASKTNPLEISDQFPARELRDLGKYDAISGLRNPLLILEDDGILTALDAEKTLYRFTYDRFYEYMLGQQFVELRESPTPTEFLEVLLTLLGAHKRAHFSHLQAIKSEVIRLNILLHDGVWALDNPLVVRTLLEAEDPQVVSFGKDLLRELAFESDFNIFLLLEQVLGKNAQAKLLALEVASDLPSAKKAIVSCFLSNDVTLRRRATEIMSRLAVDVEYKAACEEIFEKEISSGMVSGNQLSAGLIYYSAALFGVADRQGLDAFQEVARFLKKVIASNRNALEPRMIAQQLAKAIRLEGAMFFGEGFTRSGIEYIWGNIPADALAAISDLRNIVQSDSPPLDESSKLAIKFIALMVESLDEQGAPRVSEVFAYQVEYRIAQWLLIAWSRSSFNEVTNFLSELAKTRLVNLLDFCQGVMGYILQYTRPADAEVRSGLKSMLEWDRIWEENSDSYYSALSNDDPFLVNYIPPALPAAAEAIHRSPEEGPIPCLARMAESREEKKKAMAILAARWLAPKYPRKVLGTLEIVARDRSSKLSDWTERALKEVFLLHPRIAEEFFWKWRFPADRVSRIKHRSDVLESPKLMYNGIPLYSTLLMTTPERKSLVALWHERLYRTASLDEFCFLLCTKIVTEIDGSFSAIADCDF